MIQKNTKIICTIGPAIDSEKMLMKMMESGMDVTRLNLSHGSHSTAIKQITKIRNASSKVNKYVAIMLDTKGPEIRTGAFENGFCEYKAGDEVKLVKEEVLGNKEKFYINCKELFNDIQVGNQLLIDDGKITLDVISVNENEILCKFINSGIIKDHKGINAPGTDLSMPFISEKDYNDIKFGCEQDVDAFALSFVRTADDVLEVRDLLKKFGKPNIEIIAKIESQQGVDNLESILQVSDGIMVARGDLGVEVAPELVPLYQKKMIKLANAYGKLVITATHMLESMIENPRPTRAEASDVANAILDGSDAIMLSGESAVGKYPVESLQYMVKIALIAESMIDYKKCLEDARTNSKGTKNDAISMAAADIALKMKEVKAIFAFTETGGTAKRIFKFKPRVPVIACTDNTYTARKLAFYRGINAIYAKYVDDLQMCDEITNIIASSMGLSAGDQIIVIAGFGVQHGITNTIRIIDVKNDAE